MPRTARQKSESGIYHVMLRGVNRREIFHDDEDCIRFLETLYRYKKKADLTVYAWCLMGNHVHLLLGEGNESLAVTMKRIEVSFAWFYNWKYMSIGHLFQDRYKSERVENEEYLKTVVRYIHQNPVKAEMVKQCNEWKWSSCHGYYGQQTYTPKLLDSSFVLNMLSTNRETAIKIFQKYDRGVCMDAVLDDTPKRRLTDGEAMKEIVKLAHYCPVLEIINLPKEKRDEIIAKIKEIEGLSQRQIARVLGIPPNLVFKV